MAEISQHYSLEKVIIPSSIAVFGRNSTKTPAEISILSPKTIYGISKIFTEQIARYYHRRSGLDVRGVRFPGIISYKTRPSGDTTDYAVEALYEAIKESHYTYYVRDDTKLPFRYMPDAIKALVQLYTSNESDLRFHCEYNVASMSLQRKNSRLR